MIAMGLPMRVLISHPMSTIVVRVGAPALRRRLVGRMCDAVCDFACIEGRINLDGQVDNGVNTDAPWAMPVCNGRDDDCDVSSMKTWWPISNV